MNGKLINDRYQLLDKLGGGGMSIVYLAEDTILERKVAIKAISISQNEKDETMKRFYREVIVLHKLFMKILWKYMMLKKMMIISILLWNILMDRHYLSIYIAMVH